MKGDLCTAKIRPFPDDTELTCFLNEHESETKHVANVKKHPNAERSTDIYWFEEDRRTFRGDWVLCPNKTCILPSGHRGNHAD